ncbi:putative colanic acid biosynthesis acetyltransferase [Flavobacteriaceae bacterium MHTCC 0001]
MDKIKTVSKVKLGDFDASVGLDRGASKLKEMCWYIIKVLFFLSPLPYPKSFKVWLLKLFGAQVGVGLVIKPRVNIHFPWKLTIGNHVWIGEEVYILNFENVIIGDNVCISQRVFLCGGNHDYRIPNMPYRNGPIVLKSGCWVGAGVFVGPSVSVGEDTVITVGSIVTKNVESGVVSSIFPDSMVKERWVN